MKQPPLDSLIKLVENKYGLVVITAKRARVITEKRVNSEDKEILAIKPVTEALMELYNGKIDFKYPHKS